MWMPCTNCSCPENYYGQCYGGGCKQGGYSPDQRTEDDFIGDDEEDAQ